MSKIVLKTANRKTSVTRSAVRAAVAASLMEHGHSPRTASGNKTKNASAAKKRS